MLLVLDVLHCSHKSVFCRTHGPTAPTLGLCQLRLESLDADRQVLGQVQPDGGYPQALRDLRQTPPICAVDGDEQAATLAGGRQGAAHDGLDAKRAAALHQDRRVIGLYGPACVQEGNEWLN